MKIAQILANRTPGEVVTCDVTMLVRDVVATLAGKRIGALPVMQNGSVVGIFSERDLIYRVAADGSACLDSSIGDVMTAPAITVDQSDSVLDALGLMTRRRIRHLPVMDGAAMVGFISIGDLVKSRLDEIAHEAEEMRNYIQNA